MNFDIFANVYLMTEALPEVKKMKVKNSDERPHHQAYWMFPFAAKTAPQTVHAFEWSGQFPKLPLSIGDLDVRITTWFLGPTWVSPQTTSGSVQPFMRIAATAAYAFQWGRTSPKNRFFPLGNLDRHLIDGSLGPPRPDHLPKRHHC